jgi:DNA-binding FadR family transcriptional regulator
VEAIIRITIAEHEKIHDAILGQSPAEAREAMARHIMNAAARVGLTLVLDE